MEGQIAPSPPDRACVYFNKSNDDVMSNQEKVINSLCALPTSTSRAGEQKKKKNGFGGYKFLSHITQSARCLIAEPSETC
jgi:hypothetical protein